MNPMDSFHSKDFSRVFQESTNYVCKRITNDFFHISETDNNYSLTQLGMSLKILNLSFRIDFEGFLYIFFRYIIKQLKNWSNSYSRHAFLGFFLHYFPTTTKRTQDFFQCTKIPTLIYISISQRNTSK